MEEGAEGTVRWYVGSVYCRGYQTILVEYFSHRWQVLDAKLIRNGEATCHFVLCLSVREILACNFFSLFNIKYSLESIFFFSQIINGNCEGMNSMVQLWNFFMKIIKTSRYLLWLQLKQQWLLLSGIFRWAANCFSLFHNMRWLTIQIIVAAAK